MTVGDAQTPVTSLTLSAASSNTTLVPNANLVKSGTTASRTLTITPTAGQSGTSTITVTVTDLEHQLILDVVIYPAIAVAVIGVAITDVAALNAYQILSRRKLIFTREAFNRFKELVGPVVGAE